MNIQSTASQKLTITRRLEKCFIFLTGVLAAGVVCTEFTYQCPYGGPVLPPFEIACGIGALFSGYTAYCYGHFASNLSRQMELYRFEPSSPRKKAIDAMLNASLLRIVLLK